MNIEEERKAFEDNQRSKHPRCDLRRWADAYRSNIVEAAFQSWLDAKAHAVEMAKPAVKLTSWQASMARPYVLVYVGGRFDGVVVDAYESKEAAVYWVETHGCRLVDE